MQAKTPKITYFELLEKLRDNPDIHSRWKTEIMSAVRQYAKRFEPARMGAVIVPAEISATLAKATPAMARLRESSFSNMISRIRVALRICGIIVQPGRHTISMAEPWAILFKLISTIPSGRAYPAFSTLPLAMAGNPRESPRSISVCFTGNSARRP